MAKLSPLQPIFHPDISYGAFAPGSTPGTEPLLVSVSSSVVTATVSTPAPTVTSFNPNSWALQDTGLSEMWDVAWSPALGLFAACSLIGSDRIATSPDGINWTSRTAGVGCQRIIWVAELGLFVAVSSTSAATANHILTSSDGITWTTRTLPVTTFAMIDVTWSPSLGLLVAVGSAKSLPATATNVYTSPDGITWTGRATPTATQYNGVAWSPSLGLFAAVRNSNTCMTSPDGISWTNRTIGNSNWLKVAWSPALGMFAAVGQTSSVVRTSTDGTTWTSRTPSNVSATQWRAIQWSPELSMFVVVGFSGTACLMTSTDGVSWNGVETVLPSPPRLGSGQHNGLAWSKELSMWVVAVLDTDIKISYPGVVGSVVAPAVTTISTSVIAPTVTV